MSYPDKAEAMAMLQVWEAHHHNMQAHLKSLSALAIGPDAPLVESIWLMFDSLTQAIGHVLGDSFENMAWYAYENDFGERGRVAGPTGKLRSIKTLADLYWLIETGREE